MGKKVIIKRIAYIVPAILIIVPFYLGIIHYNYSDDEMMNNIARGFFDGKPDEHIIFINSFIGYITKYLYRITCEINWFAVIYILLILLSTYSLLYVLNKYMRFIKAYSITLFVEVFNICWFTFTVIAYICAIVGILMLIIYIINDNKNKNEIAIYTVAIILICSSYMMRKDAFISTVILTIPLLITTFFKKNRVKKILYSVAPIVLLLVCIGFINHNSYSSRFWRNYEEFNSARSAVIDYPVASYDSSQDFYKSIGYSRNDLNCAIGWCFGDKSIFNVDKYNKIVQNTPFKTRYNINPITYPQTLKNRVSNKTTYVMVLLFIIALLMSGIMTIIFSKNKLVFILQTVAGLGLIWTTFFLNKPVARVIMPIAVVDVIALMFMFVVYNNTININRIKKIITTLEIVTFLLLTILFGWKTYDKSIEFKNDYVTKRKTVLKYINNNPESLFLCRGKLTWLYYKPVKDIKGDDTCMNIMQTGDQDIYNNCYYIQLKKLNTKKEYCNHLLWNLITRKQTYLLVDENKDYGTIDLVSTFLKEHCCKTIKSKVVKSFCNKSVNIYKFEIIKEIAEEK